MFIHDTCECACMCNTFPDFPPPLERPTGPAGATDGECFLEGTLPNGLATSPRRPGFCCCADDAGTTGLRAAAAATLGGSSALFGLITLAGRLLYYKITHQLSTTSIELLHTLRRYLIAVSIVHIINFLSIVLFNLSTTLPWFLWGGGRPDIRVPFGTFILLLPRVSVTRSGSSQ